MIRGYARVSTQDQDLTLQRRALLTAGCQKIWEEKVSGKTAARPELAALLKELEQGDLLIVTRLDRLARSTSQLLQIVDHLGAVGVGFRSIAEPWADTTSPAGRMIMTIFAGIAEFERSLILERTSAGRAEALANGAKFGRPDKITVDQWRRYAPLIEAGHATIKQAATELGVSTSTIYRRIARDAPKVPRTS